MKPRSIALSAPRSKSARFLPALTLITFQAISTLHAEQWNVVGPTAGTTNYNWDEAANWNPTSFPNGIDATALFDINILFNGPGGPNLQGTQQVNLNVPITVGNLTLGDTNSSSTGFNGNGFYTIANGTAGTLSFQKSIGNATLQKTVGSGSLDTILATVNLNSPLSADVRTGAIEIGNTSAGPLGRISGSVGITRSAGVTLPTTPTTGGGNLILSNPGNTYTGPTIVEHGTLSARLSGDILASTDSNFGNSATPIVVGTASTVATGSGSSILNFIASNDTSNYTVSRGLNLSAFATGQIARQTVNFNGNLYNFNPAGGLNTNRLTLSGPITIGDRNTQFGVLRSGMTMDITGDITGTNASTSDGFRFNNFPSPVNADGRGAGTIRLSNLDRTFSAVTSMVCGTLIIDGVVGPIDSASPVGLKTMNFNTGSGGNILGGANFNGGSLALDTSADTTRALFLESAGSMYERAIFVGAGGSTTATGVTGASTGSTAIPALYGLNDGSAATDLSRVNVINGFKFGGLNTSGTVTFSNNITSGTVQVGNTNTNNTINVGVNLALISATGGTADFTGVISDTSNGVAPIRPSVTRVTINQFRNHPNLDGNNGTSNIGADGIPDAAANAPIGTATGGTVVLSGNNLYEGGTEVLGGTLTVNNTAGSGTGTGPVTVVSGAKLGGTGTITGPATIADGGGLAFTVNTTVALHDPFDITGALALSGASTVTILSGIGTENGTYVLATAAGGITGTLPALVLPSGMAATLAIVGNQLQLNVTAPASADYPTWAASFGLSIPGNGNPEVDADGDGLTNQQEYAFGLAPNSGASVNPIIVQLNKATGKFTYTRRIPTLPDPDLVFTIETSTTLLSWTKDLTATQSVVSTTGDVQTVEVTLSGALPLTAPKLFVRVLAE